jgi:hypothetical protein
MSNMRIVWNVASDNATLSASPLMVGSLFELNLQDPTRARVVCSTSTASQQILGDFDADTLVNSLVLWRHNLSNQATWRIELFDEVGQAGNLVYDSEVLPAINIKALNDLDWGVEPLGASAFTDWALAYSVLWFAWTAARSFRLTLSDPLNSDGYIEASRLIVGRYFEPKYNASFGSALAWVDTSTHSRTAGGTLRTNQGPVFRQLKLFLDLLDESDRTTLIEIMRTKGKRKDVFVSLYPEVGGSKERDHSFVGKHVGNHENIVGHHQYNQDLLIFQES